MERFSISQNAQMLADAMHEIAVWSKTHPNAQRFAKNLLKLPPVFTSDKYGDPKGNLIAMIKTLSDYEESDESLTLSDLPKRYNEYGGTPNLEEKDLRKVHNWAQQVSFGIRAAMLDKEISNPTNGTESDDPAERIYQLLYANCPKRAFVTYASDNRYELKPLRYADDAAKKRWIKQEYTQLTENKIVTAGAFGARPSQQEWDAFGLRGQIRTAFSSVSAQIEELVKKAEVLDSSGKFSEADNLDLRLKHLSISLEGFEQLSA
jgi:hypothetical protein